MASLLEILSDPQFQRDVKKNAGDLAQSASNTIAETVTTPVDLAAWLLRKSGVPVPQNPVMGSDWAKQKGFMPQVDSGTPKLAGEALGLLAPLMGTKQGAQATARYLNELDDYAMEKARRGFWLK